MTRTSTTGRRGLAGAAFGAMAMLALSAPASSQETAQGVAPSTVEIERAMYLTCRQVSDMAPALRREIAVALGRHSAAHRGLELPLPAEVGDDLAYLVRGGCTLYPDAYLFAVIDRAIIAELLGSDR